MRTLTKLLDDASTSHRKLDPAEGLVGELNPTVAVLSEEHRVERVGPASDILHDEELLLQVNLIHEHLHLHGAGAHRHRHSHHPYHGHKGE